MIFVDRYHKDILESGDQQLIKEYRRQKLKQLFKLIQHYTIVSFLPFYLNSPISSVTNPPIARKKCQRYQCLWLPAQSPTSSQSFVICLFKKWRYLWLQVCSQYSGGIASQVHPKVCWLPEAKRPNSWEIIFESEPYLWFQSQETSFRILLTWTTIENILKSTLTLWMDSWAEYSPKNNLFVSRIYR